MQSYDSSPLRVAEVAGSDRVSAQFKDTDCSKREYTNHILGQSYNVQDCCELVEESEKGREPEMLSHRQRDSFEI